MTKLIKLGLGLGLGLVGGLDGGNTPPRKNIIIELILSICSFKKLSQGRENGGVFLYPG